LKKSKMYRILNILAFVLTIIWFLKEHSFEPIIVLLITISGFFRDNIHGIIGKNIFTLTSKPKLIRNFSFI